MSDQLKTPKGTVDYAPPQMKAKERAFGIIRGVFKRHGALPIETPTFELKSILMEKYGEESKLIYELDNQGGELCALRYDLTVPFARYCAMNDVKSMKRYQIGRVYRRDQPAMARRRFREFYQCDFDICGDGEPMLADAEVISVLAEILSELSDTNLVSSKEFTIKINHRAILARVFELCGITADFRQVCSAIDKLDKLSFDEIRGELIGKGLDNAQCAKLSEYVSMRGQPREMPINLCPEIGLLFDYLNAMGCAENVILDISLARGLDYYTGVIFEAVSGDGVGSIAGGGRYDNLLGNSRPSVGFSLGLDRLMLADDNSPDIDVYVASAGNVNGEKIALCAELWRAGIRADFSKGGKLKEQLGYASRTGARYVVIVGEAEIARGIVQFKDFAAKSQSNVARGEIVAKLTELCKK